MVVVVVAIEVLVVVCMLVYDSAIVVVVVMVVVLCHKLSYISYGFRYMRAFCDTVGGETKFKSTARLCNFSYAVRGCQTRTTFI